MCCALKETPCKEKYFKQYLKIMFTVQLTKRNRKPERHERLHSHIKLILVKFAQVRLIFSNASE